MVVALPVGACALVVAPQVASAYLEGAPTCGGAAHHACIYSSDNWVGEIGDRGAGGGVVNVNTAYNDQMDSYWNETNTHARWYYNANGGGTCTNMSASTKDDNINVFSSDELTSWATNGLC